MIIDFFVLETFARLNSLGSFLSILISAIPAAEHQSLSDLAKRAQEGDWPYETYSEEKYLLEEDFKWLMPKLTSYSVISMLYTVVETQLLGFCLELKGRRTERLEVEDLAGKGIDRSASYLELVIGIPIRQKPQWSSLKEFQLLRNTILHQHGRIHEHDGNSKKLEHLFKKYPGVAPEGYPDHTDSSLIVPFDLCQLFLKQIRDLFTSVFKDVGCSHPDGRFTVAAQNIVVKSATDNGA
jgi:hypothetical protein